MQIQCASAAYRQPDVIYQKPTTYAIAITNWSCITLEVISSKLVVITAVWWHYNQRSRVIYLKYLVIVD